MEGVTDRKTGYERRSNSALPTLLRYIVSVVKTSVLVSPFTPRSVYTGKQSFRFRNSLRGIV